MAVASDVRLLPACRVVALLLVLTGCTSSERALRIVGCDGSVAPLVTNIRMNSWGLGSFACVRMQAASAAERARLEAACAVTSAERTPTEFSRLQLPIAPPDWWDVHEGERVESVKQRGPGGHWERMLYIHRTAAAEAWLMCAGGR